MMNDEFVALSLNVRGGHDGHELVMNSRGPRTWGRLTCTWYTQKRVFYPPGSCLPILFPVQTKIDKPERMAAGGGGGGGV